MKVPAPKYYVMYNGKASRPEYQELKLSDAFEEPSPGYEWTAHVYNINAGYNPELMDKCDVLHGYSVLVDEDPPQSGQRHEPGRIDCKDLWMTASGKDASESTFLLKHKGRIEDDSD